MKNYDVLPLFNFPLFNGKIQPLTLKEKELIFNVAYERMEIDNGWLSEDIFILNRPEFSSIRQKILNSFDTYINDVLKIDSSITFDLTTSWAVKHDRDDWSQVHVHTNSVLSGILYVQVDDISGNIIFHKDESICNLFPSSIDVPASEWNIFNSKTWKIKPENNNILFFPSTLKHSVQKNKSFKNRFSLAFNFFPKGKFSNKLAEIELK